MALYDYFIVVCNAKRNSVIAVKLQCKFTIPQSPISCKGREKNYIESKSITLDVILQLEALGCKFNVKLHFCISWQLQSHSKFLVKVDGKNIFYLYLSITLNVILQLDVLNCNFNEKLQFYI